MRIGAESKIGNPAVRRPKGDTFVAAGDVCRYQLTLLGPQQLRWMCGHGACYASEICLFNEMSLLCPRQVPQFLHYARQEGSRYYTTRRPIDLCPNLAKPHSH